MDHGTCSHCDRQYRNRTEIRQAWNQVQSKRKLTIREYFKGELILCHGEDAFTGDCFGITCPFCIDRGQCKHCRAGDRTCHTHINNCEQCHTQLCGYHRTFCMACITSLCKDSTCKHTCKNCGEDVCYNCLQVCSYNVKVDKGREVCVWTVCGSGQSGGEDCRNECSECHTITCDRHRVKCSRCSEKLCWRCAAKDTTNSKPRCTECRNK